ncbi:hypothetical protein SAMN05216382_2174 [Sphingomonas palmae]|uniref:Uncharacterized protein n=1 Tax=Sphingomonas palmae TaxID=1855283 RepID=A0A1H7RB76_9SPHN|nr:hypothetical protein [Sphingomonas palmae]SEL56687.1 hypothetical protein SAMN05216382_2174 [Sphingomonas palmae]
MTAFDALHAAPADVRAAALGLLDAVSAPLTERQLVTALRKGGLGVLEARRVARSLRKVDLIAVSRRSF